MVYSIQQPIFYIAMIWLATIFYIFILSQKNYRSTIGLPLSFVFATLFSYIGFLSYLVPGYSHDRHSGNEYLLSYNFTEETVLAGTIAVTLGIVFFVIGWRLYDATAKNVNTLPNEVLRQSSQSSAQTQKLLLLLSSFLFLALIIQTFNIQFPMVNALTGTLENAGIVLFCVGALNAIQQKRPKKATLWLLASGLLPIYYLVVVGFLSRGFFIFTIVSMFWVMRVVGPKIAAWIKAIGSMTVLYVLTTLFLTWFSFRNTIRNTVWGGGEMSERIKVVSDAFKDTSVFNPFDFTSLDQLNTRLNQYIFVGKAIEFHAIFPDLRLFGKTLLLIPFAVVPRAIWPEKPTMYQTPFVEEHTGMLFSGRANFGAGQVFEFYVNFGYVGVALGFLVMGALLRFIDHRAASAVNNKNLLKFSKWFVVGIAFIAPLTQAFFIANSAIFAFLIFSAIEWFMPQQSAVSRRH